MKRLITLLPILLVLSIMFTMLTTSCDKRNPPVIGPVLNPPPPLSQERHITRIVADPDTIYADNNITFANIYVTVKDGEGFGVSGQIVQFKTDLGRVLTNVATDSTGVAKSTFWDDMDKGTATIRAIVRNYSTDNPDSVVSADTASIVIYIDDQPEIESITLEAPSTLNPLPLTVMQTISISAKAKNVLGNDVPDNTLITFSTTRGYFVDSEGTSLGDSLVVATANGKASATYNAGPNMGTGIISARLTNKVSNRNVLIAPGRPAFISLKSYVKINDDYIESDTCAVNSPNNIYMKATLKDLYSNICPLKPVKFTTNLGTFSNTGTQQTTNTDASGIASVQFTPGLQAGAATITAFCNGDTLQDQIIFTVKSDQIHSISFSQTEQINLNVVNTGGNESAILRVKLRDINGNLIDSPQNVYFKILNTQPLGINVYANLNNVVSDPVLVVSSGGEAQISVNSGDASGVLIIKAYCMLNGVEIVHSIKSNIVVHSGPPNTVVPFIGAFNSGVNMGGGLWRVVAGAIVKDLYGNPVDYGTAVWFYLPTDTYNCQIVANAYCGNESVNGDSLAGVAFTTLTYAGANTFEPLLVRVQTGDMNGNYVYGEATVILPLNQPQLSLISVPTHLDFYVSGTATVPAYRYAYPAINLFDSQGNPIHSAQITLTSNRGEFVYYYPGADPLYPNLENEPYTVVTGANGVARGKLAVHYTEVAPPNPDGTPGETPTTIFGRIYVNGDPTAVAQTTITCLRYSTPTPNILITSPSGGEKLDGGANYTINWLKPTTVTENCSIKFTVDNGENWYPLSLSTAGTSFVWNVPNGITSHRCMLKVSSVSNSSYTNTTPTFSIVSTSK